MTDRVAILPEILRENGYKTFMAGKWGLGGPAGIDPAQRGFEHSFVLLPNGGGHYAPIFHDSRYVRNGQPVAEPLQAVFSTTLFTDALIELMNADTLQGKPFFAFFAPTAPHWPLHYPPGMTDRYDGAFRDGYEQLRQQRIRTASEMGVLPQGVDTRVFQQTAAPWDTLRTDERELQQRVMEIYAAMVEHLDEEIGRLLDHLESVAALDNTIILFINDNGAQGGSMFGGPPSYAAGREFDNRPENIGAWNSWANMGQGWAEAVTAPFRGNKGSVYEGGLRVAAFAHWTGREPQQRIDRQLLTNMDVMPTVLELAGAPHPAPAFAGRQVLPPRGQSFAAVLEGRDKIAHLPEEAISLSSAGRHFMYKGDWKILKELQGEWQLFNLANDPYERVNLANSESELLETMLMEFNQHARATNILDR